MFALGVSGTHCFPHVDYKCVLFWQNLLHAEYSCSATKYTFFDVLVNNLQQKGEAFGQENKLRVLAIIKAL